MELMLILMMLVSAPALAPAQGSSLQLQVRQAHGDVMPELVSHTTTTLPALTPASFRTGQIDLEIVVDARGVVRHSRVSRPLSERLDAAAIAAATAWKLRPAQEDDGTAVDVLVGVQFTVGGTAAAPTITGRLVELPQHPLQDLNPAPEVVSPNTPGLHQAEPFRIVEPFYTPDALQEQIAGTVSVGILILADGSVGEATIVRSLDDKHGLDEQALIAARYWLFKPGTLKNKPVATRALIEIDFTLQGQ